MWVNNSSADSHRFSAKNRKMNWWPSATVSILRNSIYSHRRSLNIQRVNSYKWNSDIFFRLVNASFIRTANENDLLLSHSKWSQVFFRDMFGYSRWFSDLHQTFLCNCCTKIAFRLKDCQSNIRFTFRTVSAVCAYSDRYSWLQIMTLPWFIIRHWDPFRHCFKWGTSVLTQTRANSMKISFIVITWSIDFFV